MIPKMVYICHPLTSFGDVRENQKRVQQICSSLVMEQAPVVPISPIHAFSFFDTTGSQEIVMGYCLQLLNACHEIWVYGDWQKSSGCREEVAFAQSKGIPIRFQTK